MAETGFETIILSGRIDSGNAQETEKHIFSLLEGKDVSGVVLDAKDLVYISSAGLRIILHMKKTFPNLKIINVRVEVYDILEMTGFTEMMTVEKAYREVSVEGCEVIGEGFNGKVYRIDRDNVVKTYKNADALAEIQHEREVAKLALILGIPTAISYDVVKVGDSYGSVFELLEAKSFSKILANEPEKTDFCVAEYVKMLKKLHTTHVPEGKLPRIKEKVLSAVGKIKDRFGTDGERLYAMTKDIPDTDTMIHGDFHTKNIVRTGNETLIIDMDTLSVGNPIFEFVYMYRAYIGYYEHNPEEIKDFQGYDIETAKTFWHKTLCAYFGTSDEAEIKAIEDKIRCLAYSTLIEWRIRHFGEDTESKAIVELLSDRLREILPHVSSLELAQADDELTLEATNDNLQAVLDFVDEKLGGIACSPKAKMQMEIAVEEVFVNIANYAYAPDKGSATVRVEVTKDPVTVCITFIDRGMPYDPLKKDDPDITLSAEEREIGGLGIFMTKQMVDDVTYEYKEGQNILTLKKTV